MVFDPLKRDIDRLKGTFGKARKSDCTVPESILRLNREQRIQYLIKLLLHKQLLYQEEVKKYRERISGLPDSEILDILKKQIER